MNIVDPIDLGRCLVTGGAGYVGRTLVARLHGMGVPVVSFDLLPHSHAPGVATVAGDLRDRTQVSAACEGVDTVFHTAALINTLSFYRKAERQQVFAVNAEGTRNVTLAAAAAGARAMVHTSSFNVAMDGTAAAQDETSPYALHARDLYSLSKIEAERIALGADQAGGLRVCALRPGGIWGCDTGSMMIREFLTQLAAGKFKALVGNPATVTDNTHVDNLVDAMLLAAATLRRAPETAGGQAFNVTDGESINSMAWFRPLVEGLGYRFPRAWVPMWLIRAVALGMEAAHFLGTPMPTLTVRGVNNLAENSRLSIDKARRILGYSPRYTQANGMPALLPAARAFVEAQRRKAA